MGEKLDLTSGVGSPSMQGNKLTLSGVSPKYKIVTGSGS